MTCRICKYRLTRIIYGMPTEEDLAKDDGYTEYAGCVIEGQMVAWKCFECGASMQVEQQPPIT